jgi:hypothetical protein
MSAPPDTRSVPRDRRPVCVTSALPSCGESSGAASGPLGFWWLDSATVYASGLGLALIASVYIGFSVADGRWKAIAVESGVAAVFVLVVAVAVTGSAWFLVAGLAGHGLKDAWHYRIRFVTNTVVAPLLRRRRLRRRTRHSHRDPGRLRLPLTTGARAAGT